ncbi:MAG TPA: hypothetical protein PLQ93_11575 [Bacteroidia bacterium]|nr:hypothetical protein [Bacteroidia bacterium]
MEQANVPEGKGDQEPIDPAQVLRDQESVSPRLGELYQDLNDFTETKHKIEELIRFRQSLIDLEESQFMSNSEEFRFYKKRAIDAINHLFDVSRKPLG